MTEIDMSNPAEVQAEFERIRATITPEDKFAADMIRKQLNLEEENDRLTRELAAARAETFNIRMAQIAEARAGLERVRDWCRRKD